jgi:4-hydroxymandelate oxidase
MFPRLTLRPISSEKSETPIFLCPAGSQKAFHPEGELAVARAARSREHLQILSTVSNTSVEDVTNARGAPVWYQLYPFGGWPISQKLVQRAEESGCPVVALTVDQLVDRNRETAARSVKADSRDCTTCHTPEGYRFTIRNKPMLNQLDWTKGEPGDSRQRITWDYVDQLRAATRMKVVIKGIVTGEDAQLCLQHGIDGIVVSNHGGRANESGWGTMECLAEVVSAVGGRIPVMVDGGFRRGRDVFKALALGASAVGIGRPYLWGLASFGQEGVERVLDMLTAELQLAMMTTGTLSIADIGGQHIGRR